MFENVYALGYAAALLTFRRQACNSSDHSQQLRGVFSRFSRTLWPKLENTSYAFLRIRTTGNKYLFPISLPGGNLIVSPVNSQTFLRSASHIRSTLPLHGFGILDELAILSTITKTGVSFWWVHLRRLYERFVFAMTSAGVHRKDVVNFFAFKPFRLTTRWDVYEEVLAFLKRTPVHLVIIVTVTSEDNPLVQPSSAWSTSCLPHSNETSMKEAVRLLSRVPQPTFNFTLTLSLRMDLFEGVGVPLVGNNLSYIPCHAHRSFRYAEQCHAQVYGHDPNGSTIQYVAGGGCAFAKGGVGANDVVSFETPTTVAYKMRRAYHALGYAKTVTHIVGWSLFNFSGGLAPPDCNSGRDRINSILKVLSDN
ncbi:uncharacterized protein LOC144108258 [Amblyomma americanum]